MLRLPVGVALDPEALNEHVSRSGIWTPLVEQICWETVMTEASFGTASPDSGGGDVPEEALIYGLHGINNHTLLNVSA